MMNNLSEIYDASSNRILTFDKKLIPLKKPIAQELISCGKYGKISSHACENSWVVELSEIIKPNEYIDTIVQSNFMDGNDFEIPVPRNINVSSLKVSLYVKMKECGIKKSVKIHDNVLKVFTKKHEKDASYVVTNLTEEEQMIIVEDEVSQYISRLYREAKKQGIKISVSDHRPVLRVKKVGIISPVNKRISGMSIIRDFISSIPYDKTFTFPIHISAEYNEKYINTVLAKLPFDTSYRGGLVTKKQFCVRVIKGEVCLRVNSQTIHVFRDIHLVSQMTEAHYNLANVLLAPYGGKLSV